MIELIGVAGYLEFRRVRKLLKTHGGLRHTWTAEHDEYFTVKHWCLAVALRDFDWEARAWFST